MCVCQDVILGKVGVSRRIVDGTHGDPSSSVISPPTSAAVAAGDVLSPLLTFGCVINQVMDSALILGAKLTEVALTAGPLDLQTDLLLFDTVFAPAAEGDPFVMPDVSTLIGVVQFDNAVALDGATSYTAISTSIGLRRSDESRDIYGVLVAREAGTFAEGAELRCSLHVVRD